MTSTTSGRGGRWRVATLCRSQYSPDAHCDNNSASGAVRLGGWGPQLVLLRAEADKEHAHVLLRHPLVCRVHQLEGRQVLAHGARVVLPLAQAGQVVAPLLLRLGCQ